MQLIALKTTNINLYSSFTKNSTIHYRGGRNFGATFGIETGQFTWCIVASKFWVGQLILDPGLV